MPLGEQTGKGDVLPQRHERRVGSRRIAQRAEPAENGFDRFATAAPVGNQPFDVGQRAAAGAGEETIHIRSIGDGDRFAAVERGPAPALRLVEGGFPGEPDLFAQNDGRSAGQKSGGGRIRADAPLDGVGDFDVAVKLLQQQERRIGTDPAGRFVSFHQQAVEAGLLGGLGLGQPIDFQVDGFGQLAGGTAQAPPSARRHSAVRQASRPG